MTLFSTDSLGTLNVLQHKEGYRFSLDPVLLAHHILPRSGEHILDLGTGCGILSLLLLLKNPDITITAVEIQTGLAELARKNALINRVQNRLRILETDMQLLDQQVTCGPVDSIVINPPYYKHHSGRINPQEERAIARHEILITLDGWLNTAKRLLKTGGKLHCIFPADRSTELLCTMNAYRITPKRLRSIHSLPGNPARLVIVEGILGAASGLLLHSPLFLYDQVGIQSREAREILKPGT